MGWGREQLACGKDNIAELTSRNLGTLGSSRVWLRPLSVVVIVHPSSHVNFPVPWGQRTHKQKQNFLSDGELMWDHSVSQSSSCAVGTGGEHQW